MKNWIAVLVLLCASCSKKADENAQEKAAPAKEPAEPAKPAKAPLSAAWLGKTVAPPGELAKIKLGSTVDEAKQASPLADTAGTQESEIEGVAYAVTKDTEKIITDLVLRLPPGKKAVIEEAWGPGQEADRGGKPVTVWFNPETGIRAAYDEDGDRVHLRFEPYVPLVKLLGDGPAIAALAKPFAGKTKEELATIYPEYSRNGGMWLPATEWEFGSGIPLSPYPMSRPIVSLAFSIPFNTKGKGEAEVMEVITKKWGAAKGEVPFGNIGKEKTHIYNKKDPRIEVTGPGGYNAKAITIRIGGK
jgi:hypothetical protein